jgi:dTDP-4-dehydrorhamnose 3,5-epimerase
VENFTVEPLSLPEVLLVRTRRFNDLRGWFSETWSEGAFAENRITCHFVQDNHSCSARRGTVRGLHFQIPPVAQAKLVRVVRGAILDVAVDLRNGSKDYGLWCSAVLSAQSGDQLFIPRGFAHGFCTLEDATEVVYKVDNAYSAACDAGLRWDDPSIGISWPIPGDEAVLSPKDAALPRFINFKSPF